MKRRRRARRKRRRKAMAAVPRRVARGSWSQPLVSVPRACSDAREAFRSAGLEHGTETRSQPASGARQTEKLSARESAESSPEAMMKHPGGEQKV